MVRACVSRNITGALIRALRSRTGDAQAVSSCDSLRLLAESRGLPAVHVMQVVVEICKPANTVHTCKEHGGNGKPGSFGETQELKPVRCTRQERKNRVETATTHQRARICPLPYLEGLPVSFFVPICFPYRLRTWTQLSSQLLAQPTVPLPSYDCAG